MTTQSTIKTFYFNTGVKPGINAYLDKMGTQIPFDCENVPEGATFKFACDNPNIKNESSNYIVREIKNSRLASKYAYFSNL